MARIEAQRGASLTELVVALAIFGLIAAGVMLIWSKAQEAYFVGSEAAESQQNLRAAVDFLVRELRAAGRDVTLCAFDYAGPTGQDCTPAKAGRCAAKLGGAYASCSNVFALPFGSVTATSIRIRSDRNDSGTVADTSNAGASDAAEENVLYELARSTPPCPEGIAACLVRDDGGGPAAMVAVDIAGFQLTYYPRPGYPPCSAVPPPSPCPPFTLPLASQREADNIGRVHLAVDARTLVGGAVVTRRLETDVVLRNRH